MVKEQNWVICSEADGHTVEVSQKEKNKYYTLMHICGI